LQAPDKSLGQAMDTAFVDFPAMLTD